jgi:uncharacterized membrane protein YraQ (UPF0718 family)
VELVVNVWFRPEPDIRLALASGFRSPNWYLAPGLAGLFLTLVAATFIEVCSEGSVLLAADLMTRAAAPGNAFTFLIAGAATDYTEILVLREVTGRLKAALLLPLLTVPQVLVIGWALNAGR